jgi:hypothetical protein
MCLLVYSVLLLGHWDDTHKKVSSEPLTFLMDIVFCYPPFNLGVHLITVASVFRLSSHAFSCMIWFCGKVIKHSPAKSWDTVPPSPAPSQRPGDLRSTVLPRRIVYRSMLSRDDMHNWALVTWWHGCRDFACRCLPPHWIKMTLCQNKSPS